MSKSNYLENELLKYIFNNVAPSFAGDAAFYMALHTADPTEAGTGDANEVAYTGYARVLVARNAGGFTVVGDTASNTAQVQFPVCVNNAGGTPLATHWSLTRGLSGATDIIYSTNLGSSLAISQNVMPTIGIGSATVQED